MTTKITWEWPAPALGEDAVRGVGRGIGVALPDDYVGCAAVNHGGKPTPNCLDFGGAKERMLEMLLPLTQGEEPTMREVLANNEDLLPEGVIPFAGDPFGNYYCFDYRSKPAPAVVFWDHEAAAEDPDGAITRVASSFTELLGMLYEPE